MQRLVVEYVWPELDPDEDQRRNHSRIAVEIFKRKDNEKAVQYNQLKKSLDQEGSQDLQQFARLEILRRDRQAFTEKWVEHALYSDRNGGFEDWQILIDKVRGGKRYNFALRLCKIARAYQYQFNEEQLYIYKFLYTRALADAGQLHKAEIMLRNLLKENKSDPDRKASILNQLGVVSTRLGDTKQALRYQRACLELIPESNKRAVANVHNQIGYNYRLLDDFGRGNRKKAQQHFQKALDIATSIDVQLSDEQKKHNRRLIASAANNLGYIYGKDRQYDEADQLFQRAIRTWQSIGETREIARAETAQGILARNRGFYDQAIRFLSNAISRLVAPDDHQMLCRAHFHLGWTQWFMAVDYITGEVDFRTLRDAVDSLRKSRDYAEKYELQQEQPGVYHQLASVLWRLGMLTDDPNVCKEARELNQMAYSLSCKLNDIRYAVDSLLGEAEFDLDIGKEDLIEEYAQELKENFERKNYNFPLYYGRMRRIQGDFAFARRDFKSAFSLYAEGFYLINQHGGFGPYLIEHELRHLSQKMQALPTDDAIKWLKYLQEKWENLPRRHQRIDLLFWCTQEIQQTQLSS